MCSTCGCGRDEARVTTVGEPHGHDHRHDHGHGHGHGPLRVEPDPEVRTHTLALEVAVLAKNDDLAARNRAWLAEHGVTAVNLMSSPGPARPPCSSTPSPSPPGR